MASIDVSFGRAYLAEVMPTVRKHASAAEIKAAWVWSGDRKLWEFHGPGDFYWYGRAGNAYDARASGWLAWLRNKGIDE